MQSTIIGHKNLEYLSVEEAFMIYTKKKSKKKKIGRLIK